jgi:hypothetical protein
METIHVKNLEKYHPGYKDRNLIWCKTYFKMLNSDPEFELLCEIDKWRFIALVMLELQIKKPVPNDPQYLKRKGFDLRRRPICLTLQMLHNLVEVCNDSVTQDGNLPCHREDKDKEKNNSKSSKRTYLEFVLLTDEEHKKLIDRFGADGTKARIEELNNAIGSKGLKYKSHYHTILAWENRSSKKEHSDIDDLKKRLNRISKEQ